MFNNISPDDNIDQIGQDIEGEMEKNVKHTSFLEIEKSLQNPYGQNPYSVKYQEVEGFEELLKKIKTYAENFTRLEPSTITRDINYLRLMENKQQPFPIDFKNPNYTQYLYHMTWYKENIYNPETGKNFFGLKQRKEAMELYLKACGIPLHYFIYELPERPRDKPIEFPNPDLAFEITRYKFTDDKEENWMYQFIHTYNFIVGGRPPSETSVVTLDMIDWDNKTITYPQQKKHRELRKVYLHDVFLNGKTRKSLKNYVDYHRPRFENQYSKDYLFLSPKTGRPFTARFLGKKLNEQGKMVYKKWYPYMARHFCATGKLIEAYLNKDPDPIKYTQDYMYHDSRRNTERYTKHAREFYNNHAYNWFKRILRNKNNFCWGKSVKKIGQKSKQSQKTFVSHGNPSRDEYSPEQIKTGLLLLLKSKLLGLGVISISLIKSFLFSLYHKIRLFFYKKYTTSLEEKEKLGGNGLFLSVSQGISSFCFIPTYSLLLFRLAGWKRNLHFCFHFYYISPHHLKSTMYKSKKETLPPSCHLSTKILDLFDTQKCNKKSVLQKCYSNTKKGNTKMLHFFARLYKKVCIL